MARGRCRALEEVQGPKPLWRALGSLFGERGMRCALACWALLCDPVTGSLDRMDIEMDPHRELVVF